MMKYSFTNALLGNTETAATGQRELVQISNLNTFRFLNLK